MLDLPVTQHCSAAASSPPSPSGSGGISGFWMPWTGETVCPVGNGIAAPLVTVLTERWIAGAAAGALAALAAPTANRAATRARRRPPPSDPTPSDALIGAYARSSEPPQADAYGQA